VSLFPGFKPYSGDQTVPVSWFRADSGHFLFNTKIELLKNHFSGLMVVKPSGSDHYRVVFITAVGLKVFDMEFFPNKDTRVHYIMEGMNRKALIRTLTNDIGLVLMNRISHTEPVILNEKGSNDRIFKYPDRGRKSYYHVEGGTNYAYLVKQTAGITNKVKAGLYGTPLSGIDSIKIFHYNFRLSIDLYRIHEETNHAAE
jgi:hypothetical protein